MTTILMNTATNPFLFMITNIFTIPPKSRCKPSKYWSGGGPRLYHTQGCIGCKLKRQAKRSHQLAMLLIPWHLCAAFATSKSDQRSGFFQPFNSDSFHVKIDNCASKSRTNCIDNFFAPPDHISINIIGVGGNVPCTHIGIVCWESEDDDRLLHQLMIPWDKSTLQRPHIDCSCRNTGPRLPTITTHMTLAPGAPHTPTRSTYIGRNATSKALYLWIL